jgi:hypothetical protein
VVWGEKMVKLMVEQEIDEENIYAEDSVEMLLDEDEISAEEEGFMLGYMEAM